MRFKKLGLYLRTVTYLRRGQLAQMLYRRIVRKTSKPHRALDRVVVREVGPVDFHPSGQAKALDRLFFERRTGFPAEPFDWQTSKIWQPLRYQPHYFDYLLDPARSAEWKLAIVADWIAHNAPDGGDGWIPYAVSLRTVNWIKYMTDLSPALINDNWRNSLYDHALWLENNLELHILANHYLKNAKALIFAGIFFTGTDADRWRRRGLDVFLSELQEQFLSDGGHYERSPMYHAITVEDILDVYTYLNTGAVEIPASTFETLRKHLVLALDFYSALLLPGEALPLLNDTANDVGPSATDLFAYAKATLGYELTPLSEGLTIRALQPSGYFVIRAGKNMVVIDCGPLGPRYQPGHGHADCLSYELVLSGERIVVDSGVFDYENNAARDYARSTEAHNTVQVDGLQQSEMWDVFRVARRANPLSPSLALIGPGQATFSGAHDGFARSAARAIHERTVRYDCGEWIFEDRISGSGGHLIESRVHLHPSLSVNVTGDVVSICAQNGLAVAELRATLPSRVRIESAPYYPRFGSAEAGSVVVMTLEGPLPATMSYTIAPVATTI